MNGQDALKEIAEKENEQKMEILKNEVQSTGSVLRDARECVKLAKEALTDAEGLLVGAEQAWDEVLKKEARDVELPSLNLFQHQIDLVKKLTKFPVDYDRFPKMPELQHNWIYDPGPSCRCVTVHNQEMIRGRAMEDVHAGSMVTILV